MERLTPKNYKGINLMGSWIPPTIKNAMWNKLGKLEDLEEQIGCPLEVLFRALKDGIYHNENYGKTSTKEYESYLSFSKSSIPNDYCIEIHYYFDGIYGTSYYSLKDYKKTWWLKADRSE